MRAPGQVVQRVTLRNLALQTETIGLEVKGDAADDPIRVFVESGLFFRLGTTGYAIETDDGALIHALSYYFQSSTNFWRNSGGTKTIDHMVRDLGKRQSATSNSVDVSFGAEESPRSRTCSCASTSSSCV